MNMQGYSSAFDTIRVSGEPVPIDKGLKMAVSSFQGMNYYSGKNLITG